MANKMIAVRHSRKRNYTVIATIHATGEVVSSLQHARDEYEAMARQAAEMAGAGDSADIVCAMRGDIEVFPPSDESGAVADIIDMAGECECGRKPWDCSTFEGGDQHGDK